MSASLSVIIPAYNEAARLGNTVRAVVDYLRKSAPDGEVIVVDDGSADETAEIARRSSVTSQTSARAALLGLDCSPRAAMSLSFQTQIFRHRSPRRRNWSSRLCTVSMT
jgi:cellulose synthase/poly-beta-1,6-N-acetylglucosamine synthase-like glycosyltransferase